MKRSFDGFTLVEVIVALALSMLALSAAYAMLHLGDRSRHVTASAEGLRTALLIQERMEADLGALVYVRKGLVHWWKDRPARIAFYAYDAKAATAKPTEVGVRAVRYSWGKPGEMLKREWDAREESVGTSPLASAAFLPFQGPTGPMMRVNLLVGRGPGEPEGPPVYHTFLARLPAPRGARGLDYTIKSAFLEPKDDDSESDELPRPE